VLHIVGVVVVPQLAIVPEAHDEIIGSASLLMTMPGHPGHDF
jgi:hypothetical protein